MGQLIDISKAHEKRRYRARVQKNMAREIRREMRKNEESQAYERQQAVEGFRPSAFKEMPKSVSDFLIKLKVPDSAEARGLVERIILDAQMRDLSFTSTLVYLRSAKNAEIARLYRQIRAAVILTVGIALPEF